MGNYIRTCVFCGETKTGANYEGKFYCNKHWQRMYYHGTPYKLKRKSRCKFEKIGDVYKMTTSNGTAILIDEQDYERVSKYSWCLNKAGYPVANISHKVTRISRFILGLNDNTKLVDHINGNPLDNRRNNLRICTNTENARNCKLSKNNTSGYVGVRLEKSGRWRARIMVDHKEIYLGTYETKEEAIKARQEAEKKYYGEFAPCKNIDYFAQYMNPPSEE